MNISYLIHTSKTLRHLIKAIPLKLLSVICIYTHKHTHTQRIHNIFPQCVFFFLSKEHKGLRRKFELLQFFFYYIGNSPAKLWLNITG